MGDKTHYVQKTMKTMTTGLLIRKLKNMEDTLNVLEEKLFLELPTKKSFRNEGIVST